MHSHNDSAELVRGLLRRIAEEQVSISGSDLDSLEADQKNPSSGTDEYHSARQSEDEEQADEKTLLTKEFPASVITELIEKYELIPLRKSKYWERNPNSLPYSNCILTDSRGNWEVGAQASLVYGQFFRNANGNTLFCYSDLEKTAFMIPIEICNGFSCGFSLTFAPYRKLSSKLVKLRDKSAAQVFGTYIGIGGGLGVFASLSGAILKNRQNSIELHMNSFLSPGSIDVSLAYRKVELRPRRLHRFEVYRLGYLQELARTEKADKVLESNQEEYSKRFTPIADYWIHTLASNFTEGSFASPLDLKFLGQLSFTKRKTL